MPQAIMIKNMFNRVSRSYDLLNDLLSLGIHRIWKNKLIDEVLKSNPTSFLDGATGTGDIALWTLRKKKSLEITGIDFSENMLEIAQNKSKKINWKLDDLTKLSFAEDSFDVSAVSYGIRNVESLETALKELSRVSKKKICILEFGSPQNKVFRKIYFSVMNLIMPAIGFLFGKKDDYTYLIESSSRFASGDDFLKIMQDNTKFNQFKYKSFFGGITYLYIASFENNE